MPRGGFRPGSGNKKGVKLGPNKSTITKEQARDALRQVVLAHMDGLLSAQISHAKGLKYLVARDKTGKFQRLTEAQANERIGAGDSTIEVWEKDPSVQAFTDLLNRALDKPAEQLKVTGEDGGPVEHVFRWKNPLKG